MPFPNPLASLKALPRNQRVAVGVGGAGALGAGLYTLHKRRAGGASSPAASGAVASALQPAPDLSQYGQVAVLVPIDHQDGANFGGGLVRPPAPPPTVPTPVIPRPTKPPRSSSPAPTAPQYTAQTVQDLFARYGFGAVPALPNETAQERTDRILRDLNGGVRTPDQVAKSISILPGAAR